MRVVFTKHAEKRIKERGLTRNEIRKAVLSPDKLEVSRVKLNRFLAKKIYYHSESAKDHLLMVIFEKEAKSVEVVTIIDTSKISKYF